MKAFFTHRRVLTISLVFLLTCTALLGLTMYATPPHKAHADVGNSTYQIQGSTVSRHFTDAQGGTDADISVSEGFNSLTGQNYAIGDVENDTILLRLDLFVRRIDGRQSSPTRIVQIQSGQLYYSSPLAARTTPAQACVTWVEKQVTLCTGFF